MTFRLSLGHRFASGEARLHGSICSFVGFGGGVRGPARLGLAWFLFAWLLGVGGVVGLAALVLAFVLSFL